MEPRPFRIQSRDHHVWLTGQIDLPDSDIASPYPVVFMVPGGWFMDRDGYMGGSGTGRGLVYRDLADGFSAAGMAVVRYDNRGVRCKEMTMPPCRAGSSELDVTRHYLTACVDADARRTVSVQTQMDDVEDICAFAMAHPKIDPARVLVWAHSEGALNVARLVARGRLQPRGVQFVGAITESPVSIFRWQTVERYAQHLMNWDDDGDGRVTEADVERHFPDDRLFAEVAMDRQILAAPRDGWTWETAVERFAKEYENMKSAAFARPDDAPYPEPSSELRFVAASHNWWKQWFLDRTPLIDHLAEYCGSASFHIGEIDSQSLGRRQVAFGEDRVKTAPFLCPPRLVLHEGRGHALRSGEPSIGPMDETAKELLVREAQELLATP